MTPDELRSLQAPLKERFKADPDSARAMLVARGILDLPRLICRIETGRGPVTEAGLHVMTGGDGSATCAAQMLLEALVGCAGVTACAVATAMQLPITGGEVVAEGDLDFRGTLGVSRETPVGFTDIRLKLNVQGTPTEEQLAKLAQLTERYCVVAQTMVKPPGVSCTATATAG